MTTTLAILNQKGGVGKTTTVITLAHGLAIKGQRVLIVDLDTQGHVAESLRLHKAAGLYRLIVHDAGKHAVVETGRPRLHAILGDKHTVHVKRHITAETLSEYALKRALDPLTTDYDMVILDTAPGADVLQVNAFCASTHFIIPTALDHLSVEGASATLATAASLQKLGALTARFLGVVPTMWEQTTKHTKEQLEDLASKFGNLLWPPIPNDTKAREATLQGMTLWEYAPICRALSGASTSNGLVGGYARMVERLAEELEL